MSSHFAIVNKGDEALHVHAMSKDEAGRFTHAYLIQVGAGHAKTFSSETGNSFMVHETPPAHGVLLPRGVAPVDVEKPHDVPVDPVAAAEASHVADQSTE